MFVIKAKKRDVKGSLSTLRKEGEIPAVFYGAGKTSTPVAVSTIEFKKVWRKAGESSAVVVKTDTEDINVLIHEVQTDPITDEPVHVDFLAIDMKKKIRLEVPLEFSGISDAVKTGAGNLVKVLHEIEIEALPKDIPHNLTVDLTKLATIDDNILVSDIKLPDGVVVITNKEDVVASIVLQEEEKVEVVEPVDLSAIEVEKKGKKDEEGIEGTENAEEVAPVKEEKADHKKKE
ncbi:hypothetical protein A2911_01460 [Candidatus Nomurabacteria bacterium RIFCSPLOWO2_01_FULL_40_15]|uniref:Large ribosomal subunit protein bL25 n=1 Tax=Candidatus Nomurabacteria bacterium RIFCSPLOWO2_01_FULL_40_15 TaxID=1801772 RepID=A0A1F6X5P3_9BACT|nr:MAG: hypothetical protein A2911_01460 [Candidatus Nomurabacteria bacterium RIFCSPLOWO2_01_FULL_40_15]